MGFHHVRPDPVGELGDNTVLDTSVHPPRVEHLHFEIDAWTGSDLIGRFPVLLVTDRLAESLTRSGFSSFELRSAEVTFAPEAEEFRAAAGIGTFPTFHCLHVTGTPGRDDLGTTPQARLVVSDRALALLHDHNLTHCDTSPYDG